MGGQVGEISILNPDQVRFVEGEVQVELDQPGECRGRVRCGVDDGVATGHESGADSHQQFDQQCLFVGEVPVDGRSAHPGSCTDVLQTHGQETAFGDQLLGGGEQLRTTIGLQPLTGADGASPNPTGRSELIFTNIAPVSRH